MIVILGLAQSRRETAAVSADRDDLRGRRGTVHAYTVRDEQQNFTASPPGDGGTARYGSDPGLRGPSLSQRLFGRRPAPPQPEAPTIQASGPVPAVEPELPAGQAAAVPAGPLAPAQ